MNPADTAKLRELALAVVARKTNIGEMYDHLSAEQLLILLDAADERDRLKTLPEWIISKLKTLGEYYELPTDGRDVKSEIQGWMHILCFHYIQNRREVKEFDAARREAKSLRQQRDELRAALTEIRDLKPREFAGFPVDWPQQVETCAECQEYKNHPIQQGICNTHRQPIWLRQAHDKHERSILGDRAATIAARVLAATRDQMPGIGQCPKCGKILKNSWDFDAAGKQVAAVLCVGFGGSCDYRVLAATAPAQTNEGE